jgi:hypothetical protein
MTIDMTNNRVPYGLLTDEERAALEKILQEQAQRNVLRPSNSTFRYGESDTAWSAPRSPLNRR